MSAPQYHTCTQGAQQLHYTFHTLYVLLYSIMKGGCESGFNHVKPEAYPPRLLHFSGIGKKIEVREVPAAPSSLDKSDVFILDLGLEIIQW